MSKHNTYTHRGKGRPRTRIGAKLLAGVATFSLVASMCPSAAALANAGDQLAAGLADAEEQVITAQADDFIEVTEQTHRMTTGTYRVTRDVTIKYDRRTNNGIQVEKGAKVLLIIDEGKTLTVIGSEGAIYDCGYAGILLPKGSTLTVAGKGTLNATGGKAGRGQPGGRAEHSFVGWNDEDSTSYTTDGGGGGKGGGGAGAGIGTNGGEGGDGGPGGSGISVKGMTKSNVYGNDGKPGSAGHAADPAGTVIVTGSATVNATGGKAGEAGHAGLCGGYREFKDNWVATACGTSAGGGGGAGGTAADGIGSGGTGGGGGGGGASANIDGECAIFGGADLDDLWGYGGFGGTSTWGGAAGERGYYGATGKGESTNASTKYAKSGGSGGTSAAPKAVAFYTYKSSSSDTPKATSTPGYGGAPVRNATPLNSLEAYTNLGGHAGVVSGGTYQYDGKPHGVSVNNLGNLKDRSDSSAALSAQAEGDGEERSGKVTLEDGTVVSYSIVYYDEKGNALPDEEPVPVKPGQYAAVVTFASDNPDYCGDWVEVVTIAKREVAKPTPAELVFECENWATGEGKLQEAFAKMGDDYTFVADAKAEDGTASLKAAKDAGEYMACFKLNDPATCQWEGESEDTQEVWVPWSVKLQEFDPNEVTYWGTAHGKAATSLAYTGEPQWVRPWYEYTDDGEFPAWFAHWSGDKASAAVVYVKGEDDEQGLVGYHTGAGGKLEPVTAAQVYAWANGVDIDGKHVAVKSGDTVWYKTGTDGWWVPLAVNGEKPADADGSIVARDWAYADKPGVMEPGTYTAYALFDEGAGFAPTALATASVTVAKAKQSISAKKKVTATAKAKKSGKVKKLAEKKVVDLAKKAKVSAKTKVTYKKVGKAGGKKIAVAKNGKVTLKKGLKAGTYEVKVKLTAPASKNYEKAKAKTVTLTVKVK